MTRGRLLLMALWHAVAVVAFLLVLSLAGCTNAETFCWSGVAVLGIVVTGLVAILIAENIGTRPRR